MISFTIEQKRIDVFPGARPNTPAIYLNTYGQEGKQVFQYMRETGCPDFSLVAVSNLEWEHDMAPWDIPPIRGKDAPCTGGADGYLKLLLNQILPKAEKALPGIPSWRGIAGYSLAGLFAVNTEALESFYRQQGIDTIFRLNPGNHFRDGVLRTAAGLQWILEQRT